MQLFASSNVFHIKNRETKKGFHVLNSRYQFRQNSNSVRTHGTVFTYGQPVAGARVVRRQVKGSLVPIMSAVFDWRDQRCQISPSIKLFYGQIKADASR